MGSCFCVSRTNLYYHHQDHFRQYHQHQTFCKHATPSITPLLHHCNTNPLYYHDTPESHLEHPYNTAATQSGVECEDAPTSQAVASGDPTPSFHHWYTILYCAILYCTALHNTTVQYTNTILHYAIQYNTILCFDILYYAIGTAAEDSEDPEQKAPPAYDAASAAAGKCNNTVTTL
jgi:hypothetical protein